MDELKMKPPTPAGDTTTRRGFLQLAVGLFAGLGSVAAMVPMIGSLLGNLYRRRESSLVCVGPVSAIPIGEPTTLRFSSERVDGFLRETATLDVWAVRRSESELTVFSPICPHLGCHCIWDPDAKEFVCPCHGSYFGITGEVIGGPSPRPLDTIEYEIRDGVLYVRWERFRVGTADKVVV